MAKRIWNFNAGPATLPLQVLEQIKTDLPVYRNTGMAVMELSHRAKDYAEIHSEAKALLKELFSIPENYHILFLQGGASSQFFMIPMNLLTEGKSADYINTGAWSVKAIKEAKRFGNVNIAGSSEDQKFSFIPKNNNLSLNPSSEYVHLTSNNTISGSQYKDFPDTGNVPLIADMSSDILSRKVNVENFSLIYAGAQKNLGPAGVTIVILKDDILSKCNPNLPTMLKYSTHVEKDSLFNTGPTFSIYVVKLVLEWIKSSGSLEAIEKENNKKADLLYGTIDENSGFFKCPVEKDSRSFMNAVFRLPTEDLEKKFIEEATANGFGGIKGHRSVGGIRVSMYNAMPYEGIKEFTDFMLKFAKDNS